MTQGRPALFPGRHFEDVIIVLCVRWTCAIGSDRELLAAREDGTPGSHLPKASLDFSPRAYRVYGHEQYSFRRQVLASMGPLLLASRLSASENPMRGVFVIMATPYNAANAVDFEDLAGEVRFLDRCGAHGMVWPQLASEYSHLTTEERMHGMEVLAAAAKGRHPALVLGVQGPNTEAALAYARHAERLAPDGLIAMPPAEAKSLDDCRGYYRALARSTSSTLIYSDHRRAESHNAHSVFPSRLSARVPELWVR